jgi:hypothetical protein
MYSGGEEMKVNLEKLSIREQRLLIIAGLCVTALLLRTVVVYPLWKQFQELDDEILRARAQLALLKEEIRSGHAIEKQYLRMREILQPAGTPSEEKDILSKQINEIVKRHKIECQSIEAKNLPHDTTILYYDKYAIELAKAKSDITGFIRFLHEIDTTPGLLCVERINVAREKDDPSGLRVEFGALLTKIVLPQTTNTTIRK